MESENDLGFEFRVRKDGSVDISHHGKKASTLRGRDASAFLAKAEGQSPGRIQQMLARLTGNYKRGNERAAARHPRNTQNR